MSLMTDEIRIESNSINGDFLEKVKEKIRNIHSWLPVESLITARINPLPSGYWCTDLSVKHARGHIAVKRFGLTADKSVDRALREVQGHMKMWRIQNEIEAFRLDRTVEFESYTELVDILLMRPNGLDVLAIDDDPAALKVIEKVLSCFGCRVTTSLDPDKAIDHVLNQPFDLMILDWNLPYKSGKDFLKECDSLVTLNEVMPVVVCSSLPWQQIDLPKVNNFRFLYPWFKGVPFSSLVGTFEKTLNTLSCSKAEAHWGATP